MCDFTVEVVLVEGDKSTSVHYLYITTATQLGVLACLFRLALCDQAVKFARVSVCVSDFYSVVCPATALWVNGGAKQTILCVVKMM